MKEPRINLLLATYNGDCYLAEQLDSIQVQTHTNWIINASDDGSTDNTVQMLKNYQDRWGTHKLVIDKGPANGFAANFLSLIHRADKNCDFYAYMDQDDIWDTNKLERALAWLKTIPANKPALYGARTKLVDANKNFIRLSLLFKKPMSFLNALVQNVAGANTMVFNQAALKLLQATNDKQSIVSHDWWTYLLVSGAGGELFYDSHPSMLYRQHGNNLVGNNNFTWQSPYRRIKKIFKGLLKQLTDCNMQGLVAVQHVLTEENKIILNQFIAARQSRLIPRLIKMTQLRIYRQTAVGNLGLIVAILFNKL